MAVISYDETTGFEKLEMNNKSIPMIAGFIYHGDDVENERKRIEEFLKWICKKANTTYPDDLHVNKDKTNGNRVKKTKEIYCERMINFVKWGHFGSGINWAPQPVLVDNNGKEIERKGYYQLMTVYHDPLKSVREGENINNIFSTSMAANLYVKMVEKFVLKSSYINPYMKENEQLNFVFPTRIYKLYKPKKDCSNYKLKMEQYESTRNEFVSAGFKNVSIQNIKNENPQNNKNENSQNNKNENVKSGNSHSNHWEIMENTGMQSIIKNYNDGYREPGFSNYSFFMDSPEYRLNNGKLYDENHMFLFFSDCICTYIEHKIKYLTDNGDKRDKGKLIQDIINELNGRNDNMLFIDGDIDDSYDKGMGEAYKGNVFEALSCVYDLKKKNEGEIIDFYSKKWFPVIEKKVRSAKARYVEDAINKLDKYRLSNDVDQEKLLYIYRCLTRTHKAVFKSMDKRAIYTLYDIGISAYVHTGNPAKAIEQYELCKQYEKGIDRGEVNKTLNRMITCYIDEFRFKEAEALSMKLLGIQPEEETNTDNGIKKIISRLFAEKKTEKSIGEKVNQPADSPDIYKPLSSLAQAYAFQNDGRAEECFLKVVQDNESLKNFDYYITLSYLLHWYIESGERDKYEEYADKYFEGKSLESKLNNLVKKKESGDRSFGFALYIYIKAFYKFYASDKKNRKVLEKLADLTKLFGPEVFIGHPWEIIYKYSELLCLFLTENQEDRDLKIKNGQKAKIALGNNSGKLLKQIVLFGQIEVLGEEGKIPERNKKISVLWKELTKENPKPDKLSYDDKMKTLTETFTYMYH